MCIFIASKIVNDNVYINLYKYLNKTFILQIMNLMEYLAKKFCVNYVIQRLCYNLYTVGLLYTIPWTDFNNAECLVRFVLLDAHVRTHTYLRGK